MKQLYPEISISAYKGIFLLLMLLIGSGVAQQRKSIDRSDLSKGIEIIINNQQLSGTGKVLAVQDTGGHQLVLTHAYLNGEKLWLRNSATLMSSGNRGIHWYYDKTTGVLSLAIEPFLKRLSAGDQLRLLISPLQFTEGQLSLTVYQTSTYPATIPTNSSPVSQVNIEIKGAK